MVESWYNFGILYEKCKQNDEALVAYKKALEIDPDDQDARNRLLAIQNNISNQDNSNILYMKFPQFRIQNNLVIDKKYKKPQNQRNLGSQLSGASGIGGMGAGIDPVSQIPGSTGAQPGGMNSGMPSSQNPGTGGGQDHYSQSLNLGQAQPGGMNQYSGQSQQTAPQRTGNEGQYQDPSKMGYPNHQAPQNFGQTPGQAPNQQSYGQSQNPGDSRGYYQGQSEESKHMGGYQQPENPALRQARQEEPNQYQNPAYSQQQHTQQNPQMYQNPPQPNNSGIPENIPSLNQVSQNLQNQQNPSGGNNGGYPSASNQSQPQNYNQNPSQGGQPQQYNQGYDSNNQQMYGQQPGQYNPQSQSQPQSQPQAQSQPQPQHDNSQSHGQQPQPQQTQNQAPNIGDRAQNMQQVPQLPQNSMPGMPQPTDTNQQQQNIQPQLNIQQQQDQRSNQMGQNPPEVDLNRQNSAPQSVSV